MTDPIRLDGGYVDLSRRISQSVTVAASPATAGETVVATTPAFDTQLTYTLGVLLITELAYTIGTSGTGCQVRIRTGTTAGAGTVLYDSGVQTGGHGSAATLVADSGGWFHTTPTAGQQYCVTLTVASASATSTVSKVSLTAVAI